MAPDSVPPSGLYGIPCTTYPFPRVCAPLSDFFSVGFSFLPLSLLRLKNVSFACLARSPALQLRQVSHFCAFFFSCFSPFYQALPIFVFASSFAAAGEIVPVSFFVYPPHVLFESLRFVLFPFDPFSPRNAALLEAGISHLSLCFTLFPTVGLDLRH